MAMIPVKNPPSMKGPAIYRIRVQGRLEAKWSRRLEAMNINGVAQVH